MDGRARVLDEIAQAQPEPESAPEPFDEAAEAEAVAMLLEPGVEHILRANAGRIRECGVYALDRVRSAPRMNARFTRSVALQAEKIVERRLGGRCRVQVKPASDFGTVYTFFLSL